ncbi:MAG: hypothetical protein ABIJ96_14575 [Elusimicrobiota bacterium]
MAKKKKTAKKKPAKNGKKSSATNGAIDPEMDVLEQLFTESKVDFNSLLDMVK